MKYPATFLFACVCNLVGQTPDTGTTGNPSPQAQALAAKAQAPANAITPAPTRTGYLPGGSINGSLSQSADTTAGNFSALVPVWSSLGDQGTYGGSVFYTEPYGMWATGNNTQLGLSLGFRHLFSNQRLGAAPSERPSLLEEGFYLGADASFDMLDFENGGRFWQLGLGAEIGTRYLEVSGRYYLPLTEGRESKLVTSSALAFLQ